MKRITLIQLTNFIMFLYIMSLYSFTFKTNLNIISNALAVVLIGLIWLEALMLKKKIVFNNFLLFYLIFIIVCMVSVFYAIDPINSLIEVRTLILIFILMLSLINYIDTIKKLEFFMKCFIFSGLIISIYILITADFSVLMRFGSEIGNVNEIGLIIAVSSIFCLHFLIKTKKYLYMVIILINLTVILLTGSRKALLITVIAIITVLLSQENEKKGTKIKALLTCIIIIIAVFYTIMKVPMFYEIIGSRIVNLVNLLSNTGTSEGSLNERYSMITWGWEWFTERPILGYGIDNYRVLLGSSSGAGYTYSHNNIIELLVGTGIIGMILFYLSNFIVVIDLWKASKILSKTMCYSFIAIIVGSIIMSVGLVYYDWKHICIILAVGSIMYRLAKIEESKF